MSDCPWYVSAYAVRRYQQLGGAPGKSFDDASDELIEKCADVWRRYQNNPDLSPGVSRTGAYVYRGSGNRRIQIVVSMDRREEGSKPQVVDVVSLEIRRRPRPVRRERGG